MPLITPVRLLGEELSIPVVREFSVPERNEEQGVPPVSFVKNEHFGLRILRGYHFYSSESLLVRSVRIAAGIVKEIITIAVDDADY